MNGLIIFFGLLGGVAAFGFIGLVLGPVILVVTGNLLRMFARPDLGTQESETTKARGRFHLGTFSDRGGHGGNGSQKRSNGVNGENGKENIFSSSSFPSLSPLLRFEIRYLRVLARGAAAGLQGFSSTCAPTRKRRSTSRTSIRGS